MKHFISTILLLTLITLTSSCYHNYSTPKQADNLIIIQKPETDDQTESPEEQLQKQQRILSNEQVQVTQSLKKLVEKHQYTTLLEALPAIEKQFVPPELDDETKLHQSMSLLALGKTSTAKKVFQTINLTALSEESQGTYQVLQAEIDYRNNLPLHSALDLINYAATPAEEREIWHRLQLSSLYFLTKYKHKKLTSQQLAWVKLAAISKQHSNHTTNLLKAIQSWQHDYPALHPAILKQLDKTQTTTKTHAKIAVILPLTGKYQVLGNAVQNGIIYAFYQNKSLYEHSQLNFYDSNTTKPMKAIVKKIKQDGNTLVIGPLTKESVLKYINQAPHDITTLTLNYVQTNPHQNIFQFGLSPLDEAKQAAIMAWRKGHQNAFIITPDTTKGKTIADAFKKEWLSLGGSITHTYDYPQSNTQRTKGLAEALHITKSQKRLGRLKQVLNTKITFSAREREDFDVIFLVADTEQGRQIKPLLKFYYVNQPVYSIAHINQNNHNIGSDLNGTVFSDMPWIIKPNRSMKTTQKLLANTWKNFSTTKRLYALGIDAINLSQYLARFEQLPLFPYQGNSGEIYLEEKAHSFYRQLPLARFSNDSIRSFT